MTETARTATYIGIAIVLIVVAGFINRKPTVETESEQIGAALFTKLKSPEDVAGLEIVTASDSGGTEEFRVVRGPSGWTLPLHNNYPADAEKEVAAAAASLIDLKVLSVVSNLPSEHAEYGVVDPEKASPGAQGVGKLVKVLDKSGNDLVRLVIGKQDKQSSGDTMDSQELRFVRALPRDAVYRVAMPSAKFSTNFADWIETDLLKLDPFDITEVTLKDYTFDVVTDPLGRPVEQNYDPLSTMELAFNEKDSKWALKKLVKFVDQKPQPVEIAADEELNSTRLNEMKTALDDLKIVDVRPKPAGMSASLKANKTIFTDGEAIGSLRERGFYPIQFTKDGDPEILSSDGEVLVTMKDGVEYTLRFGGVAGIGKKDDETASDAKKQAKTDGKAKEDDKQGTTLNRFIMVSARFNPDLVPKPALEAVPGAGEAIKTDEKAPSDAGATKAPEAKTENNETGAKSEDNGKQAVPSSDGGSKAKGTTAPQPDDNNKSAAADAPESLQFVKLQDDDAESKKQSAPAAADPAKESKSESSTSTKAPAPQDEKAESAKSTDGKAHADADAKSTDAKSTDAKSTEAKEDAKGDLKNDDAKASDAAKPGAGDAKADQSKSDQEKAALDRKRSEKENEQKKKEYDEKIKKGEEKAAELNARFAGWYYVVSESTYRKIHLNRDDVIKKKADAKKADSGAAGSTDENGAGLDALKIPPLKIDPFKDRGDETKDAAKDANAKDAGEKSADEKSADQDKSVEKSGDAKKDDEKNEEKNDQQKSDP